MKPHFKEPKASWAEAADHDYGTTGVPRASAPPSAPRSSSFSIYLLAVLLVCGGMAWSLYSDHKTSERYAAEARAEIAQYRHTDPNRALAVYCREAKTVEERIQYCY